MVESVPAAIEAIVNYRKIDGRLATSGQPSREQLAAIADAGYEVVINLALPSSNNAVAGEADIVTAAGMTYLHIPVLWQAPRQSDLQLFFALMQATLDKKTWVHCAMNMRVSCFMYLYQKLVLRLPEQQAGYPLREIWQPDAVWQQFIDAAEQGFDPAAR